MTTAESGIHYTSLSYYWNNILSMSYINIFFKNVTIIKIDWSNSSCRVISKGVHWEKEKNI